MSLVYFYFCKVFFSGFPQFQGNFQVSIMVVKKNSNYRDGAPLSCALLCCSGTTFVETAVLFESENVNYTTTFDAVLHFLFGIFLTV